MENIRNDNLADYIKKNLSKGYNANSLKWALLNQGYSRSAVERAFRQINKESEERITEKKNRPRIKYEFYGEDNKPIKVRKPFFRNLLRSLFKKQ